MAVPFGFSAGDFIAAIGLVSDIISAIREADGATADFGDLMTGLRSLENAFITIKQCNLEPSSPGYSSAMQAVADCRRCISTFLQKISKYQSLSTENSSLRDQITKVKWALCHQKDVDKLRDKLNTLTSALSLLLTAIRLEHGNTSTEQFNKQLEKLSELRISLEERDDERLKLMQKIEQLVATTPNQSNTHEVSYEVRPLRLIGAPIAPDFVERPEALAMIEKIMLPINLQQRCTTVLHGIGGTGKSQLARHYAEIHQSDYSAVFWVNAMSDNTTRLSIASLAELIPLPKVLGPSKKILHHDDGIESAIEAVNEWFCSRDNGKWLLIFDGIPHLGITNENLEVSGGRSGTTIESFDAYEYIPKVSHGSVIATTRISSIARAFGATPIHVDAMSEDESIKLLCKACRRIDVSPEMRTLAGRLGMHPLALSQAGRYLFETNSSVSSYLEKYEARFQKLLTRRPLAREYSNGSIDATLSLSYDQLVIREPSAAALLMLWSCFDKSDIFFDLFRCLPQFYQSGGHNMACPDDSPINPHAAISGLPSTWLSDICADEEVWFTCISALQDLSFIRRNDSDDSVSLHPLIHEWCAHFCDPSWMKDNLAVTVNILGAAVPNPDLEIVGIPISRLQAHIDRWYSLLGSKPVRPSALLQADTGALYTLTQSCRFRGLYKRFWFLLDEMLDIYTRRLGPMDQRSLEMRLEMCARLLGESRWDEAIHTIQFVKGPALTIRWISTLTMKENNAFILSSFAWHLPGACCAAGKLQPAIDLIQDLEALRDDPEVVRVRPYVVFACLWARTQVTPLQVLVEDELTPLPGGLIEAAAELLVCLNDSTLWDIPQPRHNQLARSHVLRLLGEHYYELRNTSKARELLIESLESFKQIDGLQGLTTLHLAGAVVLHGMSTYSPSVLRVPEWYKSIVALLQKIEEESNGPRRDSSPPKGPTALGHMRWSHAMSAMREIVRERPKLETRDQTL